MLFDPMHAGARAIGERYRSLHWRTVLSKDSTAVLSLTAVWVLVELLIHPVGEFPLNDDWSYTRSLQQWYELHHYNLIGWTSMPLVAHLSWGMLFCKVFGFSFTVLRFSTLVLGWVGGVGAYFLSREFSNNKGLCFFTTLLLLLNPIYLNLSNTFMTDVPFTSFLILSVLFFVKGIRQDRLAYIIQGIFFILIATLIRQLGLLAAGAFALTLLVRDGVTKRSVILSSLAIGIPVAVYLLYNQWLGTQNIFPVKYDEGFRRIKNNLLSTDHSAVKFLLRQAFNIFVYAGFFMFPLVFRATWITIWRKRMSFAFITCVLVMLGIGVYCLIHRNNIPLMGNIMNPYGIGPVEMRDITILRLDHMQRVPALVWQLLCLTGIIGGGFLLWAMINGIRNVQKRDRPALWFLLCFVVVYCLVMLAGGTYDRYLIPLIPILSVIMLTGLPHHSQQGTQKIIQLSRLAAIAVLLAGAWFSVSGTTNYLSWNRARWAALGYLIHDAHVPPSQIDGGFEFNGYYGYSDKDVSAVKEKADPAQKSWWWVQDDAYMITLGPVDGYAVIKTFPCHYTFFPFTSADIYVLKRESVPK